MKNIFLVFALLIGFTAFSQQGLTLGQEVPSELTLKKGKIYQNGLQVPSYQMKKILASDLHALKLFKQAKTKETLGASLLGIGSTLTIVDLAIGLFSDAKYPTAMTYAGLSMVVISVPILSGRAKRIEGAVKSYNESLKATGSLDFELNAVSNQNGIGIQLKF